MGGLFGGNSATYIPPPSTPAAPALPSGWSWVGEGVRNTTSPTMRASSIVNSGATGPLYDPRFPGTDINRLRRSGSTLGGGGSSGGYG